MAIAGDPVAHLPESGQGLDVDLDQVARPLPLVPLHRWPGLHVPRSPEAENAEGPRHGGEWGPQEPGDVPEVQSLMAEIHGLLELLLIERPPLGAAHAPSTRQGGWTA